MRTLGIIKGRDDLKKAWYVYCPVVNNYTTQKNNMDAKGGVVEQSSFLFNAGIAEAC